MFFATRLATFVDTPQVRKSVFVLCLGVIIDIRQSRDLFRSNEGDVLASASLLRHVAGDGRHGLVDEMGRESIRDMAVKWREIED